MRQFCTVFLVMLGALHFSSIAKDFELASKLNPGNLIATVFNQAQDNRALLVLLPGCGMQDSDFAKDAGFLEMAKSNSLTLLTINQQKENNIQACFNWFSEADHSSGKGEFASIINFIKAAKKDLPVYLLGYSAGGAMASALVLQQPELFESVAIVSGIAFPCARNIVQAISCMKNGPNQSGLELANEIKAPHDNMDRAWPNLIIVSGTKDPIVNPINASIMSEQYSKLVNAGKPKPGSAQPAGISKTQWHFDGQKKIWLIEYAGLGHGLPISDVTHSVTGESPFYSVSSQGTAELLVELWF